MLSVQRDKEKRLRVVGGQLKLKSSVLAVGPSSPPRENSQLPSPPQLEQPDDYNVLFVWWAQRPDRGHNTPRQLRLRRLIAIVLVLVVSLAHSINGSTSLSEGNHQPLPNPSQSTLLTTRHTMTLPVLSVRSEKPNPTRVQPRRQPSNCWKNPSWERRSTIDSLLSLSFCLKAANCNLRNVPPQPKTSVEEPQRLLNALKSAVCLENEREGVECSMFSTSELLRECHSVHDLD